MARSLRRQLQFWYALVLAAAVAGFAVVLYLEVHAARFRGIDADLVASASYLDAALRRLPPHELDGLPPPKGPPHWMRQPPPMRLLDDLEPPGWPIPDGYYALFRHNGTIIKSARLSGDAKLTDFPPPRPRPYVTRSGPYHEVVLLGPRHSVILVGRSVERPAAEMRAFAWRLTLIGSGILLVGLTGGWWASSRIVRPIARISATAARMSAANLSERIDTRDVEIELAGLAGTLNDTFDRLEASFARLTRFTADASHELRTPLAVIRTTAELALSRPREGQDYRRAVETCLRAANRMTALVEGLLALARADAGRLDLQSAPVELSEVVEGAVDLLRPLAEQRRVRLTAELAPVVVAGDAAALGRVVVNLIENAIRYNREDGEVIVVLRQESGRAVLAVSDTGVGIPEDQRGRVFERSHRVDAARSRASGGAGLGLAICKSIVEASGGTIECLPHEPCGSVFRVTLPG